MSVNGYLRKAMSMCLLKVMPCHEHSWQKASHLKVTFICLNRTFCVIQFIPQGACLYLVEAIHSWPMVWIVIGTYFFFFYFFSTFFTLTVYSFMMKTLLQLCICYILCGSLNRLSINSLTSVSILFGWLHTEA